MNKGQDGRVRFIINNVIWNISRLRRYMNIDETIKKFKDVLFEAKQMCNTPMEQLYNNTLEILKAYKEIYDPSESVCMNCKKLVHYEQMKDSPEEYGCTGCECNLFTVGGCKEYEE